MKGREQDLTGLIEREVQFADFVVGGGLGEACFVWSAVGNRHDSSFINCHCLFDLSRKFEGRRRESQHVEVGSATGPEQLAVFVRNDFDEANPGFDI